LLVVLVYVLLYLHGTLLIVCRRISANALEPVRGMWLSQLATELQQARESEARLLEIARSEARERRRSEGEIARLQSIVTDGYDKIASVEAMAQRLQDNMTKCERHRACRLACRAPVVSAHSSLVVRVVVCRRTVRAELQEKAVDESTLQEVC
jgi:hypothetical protein